MSTKYEVIIDDFVAEYEVRKEVGNTVVSNGKTTLTIDDNYNVTFSVSGTDYVYIPKGRIFDIVEMLTVLHEHYIKNGTRFFSTLNILSDSTIYFGVKK